MPSTHQTEEWFLYLNTDIVCITYPIVANQGWKIRGLQIMQNVEELCTVDGVDGRETAPWEEAEL